MLDFGVRPDTSFLVTYLNIASPSLRSNLGLSRGNRCSPAIPKHHSYVEAQLWVRLVTGSKLLHYCYPSSFTQGLHMGICIEHRNTVSIHLNTIRMLILG